MSDWKRTLADAENKGYSVDWIEYKIEKGHIDRATCIDDIKSLPPKIAPGFMLYDEHSQKFERLTDKQIGRVIRAAVLYKTTGELLTLTTLEEFLFLDLKNDIDRNQTDYARKCRDNQANIVKRWRIGDREKGDREAEN